MGTDQDDEEDECVNVKVVAIGDGAIGKTCLLIGYKNDKFPTEYVPTIFENYTINKEVDLDGNTVPISMDLWDTAGQEEFDRLRPMSYRDANVFLLCFSVVEGASFQNLGSKWLPELQHHSPDAVIILVGLKSDLRSDDNPGITTERIQKYKQDAGAAAYIETSALKKINVDLVFQTAIQKFLSDDEEKVSAGGCCVLL